MIVYIVTRERISGCSCFAQLVTIEKVFANKEDADRFCIQENEQLGEFSDITYYSEEKEVV